LKERYKCRHRRVAQEGFITSNYYPNPRLNPKTIAGENPKGNKEIWESRERCRLLSLRKSEVGGQGQRSNRQAQKYNSKEKAQEIEI